MTFTINPNEIENDNVQIIENADGDVEIVHRVSGESITLGAEGVSTRAIDTDEAHSTQLTSESLPHWRVFKDGSETVAIDESDIEIARGTDAATVWQAALDAAHDVYDITVKEFPVVHIDGGGLRYNIDSSITIKSGAGVSHVKFDMVNAPSTAQITVGGPETGFAIGGGWLQMAEIYNPPLPVRFRDMVYAQLGPIYVRDAVGHGAEFQSLVGCNIDINVKDVGAGGIRFTDAGNTGMDGNSCRVVARANVCGSTGINNATFKNTIFSKAISEKCSTHGIVDSGRGCVWVNPTTEQNEQYGIYSNATRGHYISPHSAADVEGRFRFSGLSSECVLRGPVRGNNTITISGDDIRVEDVHPDYIGGTSGTRLLIDGVGSNGANDPAVGGEWNGNGRQGVTVTWDDGAGTNYASQYLAGGWRQVASW